MSKHNKNNQELLQLIDKWRQAEGYPGAQTRKQCADELEAVLNDQTK